jgi:hypothetical protein
MRAGSAVRICLVPLIPWLRDAAARLENQKIGQMRGATGPQISTFPQAGGFTALEPEFSILDNALVFFLPRESHTVSGHFNRRRLTTGKGAEHGIVE